jgi:K+:H+ antiporter
METLAAAASIVLAVGVVALAAGAGGRAARRLGHPPVVGEILAGVALGPSLLGHALPALEGWIASDRTTAALGRVGQVGVVLFMFLVAAELDFGSIRRRLRMPGLVAAGSFLVPFGLGIALAPLVRETTAAGVPHGTAFALFLGTALAVTALPVLARILQSAGLASTRAGIVALSAAAVEDVAAWTVLAAATAMASGHGLRPHPPAPATAGVFALVALIFVGVTLRHRGRRLARGLLLTALPFGLAGITTLGVHPAIAAFALGALLPPGSLGSRVGRLIGVPLRWVLLPVFFAAIGIEIDLGSAGGAATLGVAGLILAAAVAGKLAGATAGAAAAGLPRREALMLGVLMNTRGVTELVAILVGREAGLVPDPLFSILVVMALATTVMTAPLLRLLGKGPVRDATAQPGRERPRRRRGPRGRRSPGPPSLPSGPIDPNRA